MPVLLRDVANVTIGPEMRRGLADWNGEGETVGGIVVVRSGADTRATIERVKERLVELGGGMPDDVEISVAYDRSGLIERSIATLTDTLVVESIVVAVVCLIFLFHIRSALVAILPIPISVLLAFIVMRAQGLGSNIMSLGGIAISIGVLVDASIVMVENVHRHIEEDVEAGGRRSRFDLVLRAAQEVGPTLFFSLLVVTVSFLPVFTLEAQEGRLFKPLALTKTYSMAMASIVAVTVVPVLMFWLVRGRIVRAHHMGRSERLADLPIHVLVPRLLRFVYRPLVRRSGAAALARHRADARRAGFEPRAAQADRLRVHAAAVGGRSALHADDPARRVDHEGQGDRPADGPDHPQLPGSGDRVAARWAGRRRRPIQRRSRCSRRRSC